jgi:ribonuclease D
VAKELAAWRERTAASEDRPLGSVLGDAPLLELARRQPTEAGALDRIRGLQPSTARRRGQELLGVIARGVKEPPPAIDGPERLDLRPTDAPLIALAEALVRARALDAGLAYELLASRSDLEQVISAARRKTAEPTVRTLQGWRRELVGAELLELLAGGRQLSVDPSGRLVVESDQGPGGPGGKRQG